MAGENGQPEILDLDSLRPNRRVVRLNDREIDVSIVPFEVFLDIANNLGTLQSLGSADSEGNPQMAEGADYRGALEVLYGAMVKVLRASPDAPKQEEIDSLDLFQCYDLMMFIIKPFFQRIQDDSKNLLAAGLTAG